MSNEVNSVKIFRQSLNKLLSEVSGLEVNTVIVKEINTNYFISWEVYRDIYPICRAYLQQQKIDESLFNHYFNLRRKLELEYALLLIDSTSELYQSNVVLPILTDGNLDLEKYQTQLPSPLNPNDSQAINQVQILLQQPTFLRSLRKLGEMKVDLDKYNQYLQQNSTEKDGFFAQTIIQLDGNIINRYSSQLLKHPQQNLILNLHHKNVNIGEKQWEGLLNLLIRFLTNLS